MFNFFGRKKNKKNPTNNEPFVTKPIDNTPQVDNNDIDRTEEHIPENSDNLQEKVSDTFENVKDSFEDAFDNIQEKASEVIDNFQNEDSAEEKLENSEESQFDPEDDNTENALVNEEEHIDNEDQKYIIEDVDSQENDNITNDDTEYQFLAESDEDKNSEQEGVIDEDSISDDIREYNAYDPDLVVDEYVEENIDDNLNPDEDVIEEDSDSPQDTVIEESFVEDIVEDLPVDDRGNEDYSNGVENSDTIPLFPGSEISVDDADIDDFIDEENDPVEEFVDETQMRIDFNETPFEEKSYENETVINEENPDHDIDNTISEPEIVNSNEEEKELEQSLAFDIKKLINNKTYPLILTIQDNDAEIKEEISTIVGSNTVFLVDFTDSRTGYKVIPDSANREFAPIDNDGDSRYLDGIDIINLIKNSGDKYDGSFIIIAGLDNITDKISHALSGNQIAIDMIYEKIRSNIQDAVDNNITVIGTGYKLNESLNKFIEKLSLEDIIEDSDEDTKDKSMDDHLENNDVKEGEKLTTYTIYAPGDNTIVEEIEQDVVTSPEPVENWEDEGGATVDEYFESVGEPSVEEGLENKKESAFVDEDHSRNNE